MTTEEAYPKVLAFTLQSEGSYSNDPNDPGGATMRGITQATYDGWRRAHGEGHSPVRGITDAEVAAIYRENYWNAAGCPHLSPALAAAVFDFAVNAGVGRAKEYLVGITPSDPQAAFKLTEKRDAYYRTLASEHPQFQRFLKGWLNRTAALRTLLNTL